MCDTTRIAILMTTYAFCGALFVAGIHLKVDPRHIMAAYLSFGAAGVIAVSLEWQ